MIISEEYKILTNGVKYKVAKIYHHKFLWFKWDDIRYLMSMNMRGDFDEDVEFSTIEEARNKIIKLKEKESIEKNPWRYL
jgi:hypothetical protein